MCLGIGINHIALRVVRALRVWRFWGDRTVRSPPPVPSAYEFTYRPSMPVGSPAPNILIHHKDECVGSAQSTGAVCARVCLCVCVCVSVCLWSVLSSPTPAPWLDLCVPSGARVHARRCSSPHLGRFQTLSLFVVIGRPNGRLALRPHFSQGKVHLCVVSTQMSGMSNTEESIGLSRSSNHAVKLYSW